MENSINNIANNFISSLDNDEERVMYSKCEGLKIMINGEADEIIEELFDSLKNRYQNNLESMKNKLGFYKRVCENKDFCNVIVHCEDIKILQFNR